MEVQERNLIWQKVCNFAKAHRIIKEQDEDGNWLFRWKFLDKNYALANPGTKRPKIPNLFFIESGCHNLEKVYSMQYVRESVRLDTETILNTFFGLDQFNKVELDDVFYELDKTRMKLTTGSRYGEMDIFKFLLKKIDPKRDDEELSDSNIMEYFQSYFDYAYKREFDWVTIRKGRLLDKELKSFHSDFKKDRAYLDLILKASDICFKENLWKEENKEALLYLINRGWGEEEIRKMGFGVGFKNDLIQRDEVLKKIGELVPEKMEDFKKWLEEFNFKFYKTVDPFIALGLKNCAMRDRATMKDRITIPLKDTKGNVLAFAGRAFKDLENPKTIKYINFKETYLYQKSKVLFNYVEAEENLKNNDNLLVVEGYMDAMALNKIGIPAVAICGTSISGSQIELVKDLKAKNVFVALDFDEAGRMNNQKVVKQIEKADLKPIEFERPIEIDTKDFDEFINQADRFWEPELKAEIINNQFAKHIEYLEEEHELE